MTNVGGIAREQLKSIVERIERLEEEKAESSADIKQVFAEAKANGFDVKTLRSVIRMRKQDEAERQEQEALLDLYLQALGMLADTPLGEAAIERLKTSGKAPKGKKKGVRDPVVDDLASFGTPVPLTEEEKAKGQQAAFINKEGHRVSLGVVAAH